MSDHLSWLHPHHTAGVLLHVLLLQSETQVVAEEHQVECCVAHHRWYVTSHIFAPKAVARENILAKGGENSRKS